MFSLFYSHFGQIQAQKLSAAYLSYIDRFRDIALRHQQEYGIPASITLAQGLLESQGGASPLAINGNNHFGIKCKGDWKGESIYHDDDELQECFRKYDSAEQSYEDHALFLKRKRYSPLFLLPACDYKAWAYTLRECGYATDTGYPQKLIDIIERYKLYQLDAGNSITPTGITDMKRSETKKYEEDNSIVEDILNSHVIRRRWGLNYVIANEGDTYTSVASEFSIKTKKLLLYNDIEDSNKPLIPGEIIYLEEKGKRAVTDDGLYRAVKGDSLHSISQKFGIRLNSLCHLNNFSPDHNIKPGETLWLR